MNRKRLEYASVMLRDLGLAAVIGGAGDLVMNAGSGRSIVDLWGVGCGVLALTVGMYVAGVDPSRRRS